MRQSVQCNFDSALSHTRRSDAAEKKKKKIACTLWTKFACGQVLSPRLYRLREKVSGRNICSLYLVRLGVSRVTVRLQLDVIVLLGVFSSSRSSSSEK